ncbi:L-aspartate oxidase [Hirschia maritima]|uniref:L-aspartate oxidase n=1 Tax=Hirschia maritima TaxID=1121961 RepID=UPI00036250D9|nr:L-aspartate oxidase [Hirschia maritima]
MTSHTSTNSQSISSEVDILIVGAGLAGLFLALKLAPRKCTVISPAPLGTAASSAWAQGGLAAALHPADSVALHAKDTVAAGGHLVEPVVASLIASHGPERVRDLLELGVPFDRTENGALALSLEAAHSHPRVARVAGDLAGAAIMEALVNAARAAEHITLVEGVKAISLLQDQHGRIGGIVAQNIEDETTFRMPAKETVLCAGGSGGLFQVTTNPRSSRGDAIAMAYECGALIADPEFVQFHPTAIDVDRDPAPLATEALRGEGAVLRDAKGRRFMYDYNEAGELAPRDEVARAIHAERIAGRGAFLDTIEAVGDEFPHHFPTVFAACEAAGIDPRRDHIPVAPAAHYHMGGVVSDIWGRTTLDGLSVCGESSSTGAHGANRLASNSLLEAVVFADRIATRLREEKLHSTSGLLFGEPPIDLSPADLSELRVLMANHAGVSRNEEGLTLLCNWIETKEDIRGGARALTVSRMIARAALERKESRGGHYRTDYPQEDIPARTYVSKNDDLKPIITRVEMDSTADAKSA